MGMQRIAQSIDADPDRWSALFDQSVYRALGSDLTGAPWSCHRYGLEKIQFARHSDLKRMWFLLSTLHALHRSGKVPLLGAKIAQFLKATEVATTMGGHWAVAWTLTGVADPEPSSSVHNGLATPLEVATAIAFVKDSKVLEEASRKTGSQPHGQEGGQSWGNPSNQNGGRGQGGGGRRGRGGGIKIAIRGGVAGDAAAPQSGKELTPSDHGVAKRCISNVLQAPQPELLEIKHAVLEYFGKRVVPLNRKRGNLCDKGRESAYARSLLLGLFMVRGTGISRASRSHADLLRLCHLLGEQRPVAMRSRYVSVMVNENPHVPYHRDINNVGVSVLCSLGDYSGGRFFQTADTETPLLGSSAQGSDGHHDVCFETNGNWIMFDATLPHAIGEVTGRRLSVAFFVPARHDQIGVKLEHELRSLGYPMDLPVIGTSMEHPTRSLPLCIPEESPKGHDGGHQESQPGRRSRRRKPINKGLLLGALGSSPAEAKPSANVKRSPRKAGFSHESFCPDVDIGLSDVGHSDFRRLFRQLLSWSSRPVGAPVQPSVTDREDVLPMPLPFPKSTPVMTWPIKVSEAIGSDSEAPSPRKMVQPCCELFELDFVAEARRHACRP
eukprot:2984574-Amphidinium_carterae.1